MAFTTRTRSYGDQCEENAPARRAAAAAAAVVVVHLRHPREVVERPLVRAGLGQRPVPAFASRRRRRGRAAKALGEELHAEPLEPAREVRPRDGARRRRRSDRARRERDAHPGAVRASRANPTPRSPLHPPERPVRGSLRGGEQEPAAPGRRDAREFPASTRVAAPRSVRRRRRRVDPEARDMAAGGAAVAQDEVARVHADASADDAPDVVLFERHGVAGERGGRGGRFRIVFRGLRRRLRRRLRERGDRGGVLRGRGDVVFVFDRRRPRFGLGEA
eukprot:30067-Pelagococcus_subviridis.AAC.1